MGKLRHRAPTTSMWQNNIVSQGVSSEGLNPSATATDVNTWKGWVLLNNTSFLQGSRVPSKATVLRKLIGQTGKELGRAHPSIDPGVRKTFENHRGM